MQPPLRSFPRKREPRPCRFTGGQIGKDLDPGVRGEKRGWVGLAGWLALIATPALAYTVPAIEPIYGVTVGPQGVTVRLASHGCTTKADLTVAVAKNPPRPMVLFARKHPDACNAPATPVEVVYTFVDLGLEPGQAFSLGNPLIGAP